MNYNIIILRRPSVLIMESRFNHEKLKKSVFLRIIKIEKTVRLKNELISKSNLYVTKYKKILLF